MSVKAALASGSCLTLARVDSLALQRDLLTWFDMHARELPWRMVHAGGKRDPYRVWVSEIVLQQTQVARGKTYFEHFVAQFPTVDALAAAPQEAVLKAWEGCGYYARARNLHKAAQHVSRAGMPSTYEGWLALSGVGPYTAAAISSLAFGEARAVNDGNVRRVLARLYAQAQPSAEWVQAQADALLPPERAGDWNEALMDLGATVCTPKAPKCPACPLREYCAAFQLGEPTAYPAPKPRTAVKAIRGAALILGDATHAYLEQRAGSLLGGLYGLPIEIGEGEAALHTLCLRLAVMGAPEYLGTVQHTMTHRRITVQVYRAPLPQHLRAHDVRSRPLSRLDHKVLELLASGEQRLL